MVANNTPAIFTDEELENLKGFCSTHLYYDDPFPITQVRVEAILGRLEAAERAVDEASCLLDHPAFTVGTRSQELLPQGMAARAKSAKEAIDVWVKVTGKYQ